MRKRDHDKILSNYQAEIDRLRMALKQTAMSDNKPTWQIKHISGYAEELVAEAFNAGYAVVIAQALKDYAERDNWRYPTFEVEAPDGQKRRFGEAA